MKALFGRVFQHWIFVVITLYVGLSIFHWSMVYPIEAALFPEFSKYASLFFLPHAVRVLSTVIIGPRAFIALLPSVAFSLHLHYLKVDDSFDYVSILFVILSAASAPLAYVLMERLLGERIDYRAALLNWRFVFLVGIVASMLNSVILAVLLTGLRDASEIFLVMLRTIVGDISGLFIGLVILTFVFRILRNIKTA